MRAVTARLVDDFRARRPLRAGSLVISVFGDAIAPHGGAVWLGSLINALEPFGISSRLVRTSVFRLAKDGWLESEQIGRRSYYRLTRSGRSRVQEASERIYNEPRRDWSNEWCLILLSGLDATAREEVRREMRWLGFAPFSANLLAHPSPDLGIMEERLATLPGNENLVVLQGATLPGRQSHLQTLIRNAWELEALEDRYTEFLERFRPLYATAKYDACEDSAVAFLARTLLIHEYRKIMLRDPWLPDALLPDRWPGLAAYQLCRNIYSLIAQPTEDYLTANLVTADGPLPPAEPAFFQRFGGLKDA